MFDDALQHAKELDEYLRIHKETVGPLHGLPLSVKDVFRVRGMNSGIGVVAFLDAQDTAATESLVVKQLRELGAIFFVKATCPTASSASRMYSLQSTSSSLRSAYRHPQQHHGPDV